MKCSESVIMYGVVPLAINGMDDGNAHAIPAHFQEQAILDLSRH